MSNTIGLRWSRGVIPVSAVLLSLLFIPHAFAANEYWDTSTSANLQAGDGIWDVGTTALWSSGTGGSNPLVTWTNNNAVYFQAAGTSQITVNGAVSASSLNFDTGGAITRILAGTGSLTLTGNITAFWNNGGSSTTNQISSSLVLGNNSTITFQRNYGDGTNGNYLLIDGAISGAYKLSIAQTGSTGGGGNGTLWLNNGGNSFSGGLDAGGRYIYTTATSGTPFGTGDITTRVGYDTTPVVPIYLSPSGSGADVSLSAVNATATSKINVTGGGLFVLNKGSNNSLTFTVGNAGAAANSVINRVGARDALTIQYTNTLGTDEKFIVNGGVTVNNGMVTPYISGLKGTTDDFLTYDGTAGFKTVTYDKTNSFSGADNTSKVLLTGNLAPGADAAAYALNLRSGTLNMGGYTLAMGNGTDPAGLLIRGTISNGKVTSAGDLVVTSNGGAISASVEGAGTLVAAGAGTLKLGSDVKIANIAAGAGTVELNGSGAQALNSVVSITSGKLTKTGAGTTTFSSAGNSIYSTEITSGKLVVDNSVAANPSVSFTSTGDSLIAKGGTFQMDAGTLNLAGRFRIAPDNVGGFGVARIMGGTVNHTGSYIDMGYNSGIASLTIGGTATYNGSGRGVTLSTAWMGNSLAYFQDTSTSTVGDITVAGSNGVGGTAMYGTLIISGSAALTATRLLVGQQSNNATAATYGQVNQDGGTTTINGYVSMAENQTSGVLQGVINLKGGTLKVQDRIYAGTNGGKSFVNFHGGTLTYTGTGAKTNFIDLGANGKVFLYESSTIDTGSQNATIVSSIQSPNNGKGLSSIALNSGGSGYMVAPSVKITGGGGEGATAIAVLDASGTITEIRITNPGTGYTSTPTVVLDRGARSGGADATLGTITLTDNSFSGGLTKAGAGTLTLNAANTYSGDTVISTGTLALGHSLALQNSALNYDTGTISFGSLTSATLGGLKGSQSLPAGGLTSLTLSPASGTATFSGDIANGSATLALLKTGAGTQVLAGANTHGGGTTISNGTLAIGAGGTTGTISGDIVDNAALVFNRSDASTYSGNVSGSGTLEKKGDGKLVITGAATHGGGTTISGGTLAVGNGGASGSIGGSIVDNGILEFNRSTDLAHTGAISGSGALVKNGAGTVTLSAGTSYEGATTINQGKLIFSANKSGTAGIIVNDSGTLDVGSGVTVAGDTTVNSGGTLKGSGTLSGTTTIASGGTLSPGNSPGVLTHEAGLSLAGGSTYVWELISNDTGVAGTDFDQELITGGDLTIDPGATVNLTFNASGSAVDWTSVFWTESHSWLMMAYSGTGTSTGNFGTVNVSTDSGGTPLADVHPDGAFNVSRTGNDLYVNYVIPEPATAGILLIGLAGMALRRRRLRS